MHLAFLIAAHAHPRLLARLVRRLQSPSSSIFIHIDSRGDIRPFLSTFRDEGIDGICWVRRENSRWGTFGQVKAPLSLLREALSADPQADRFIFISGQDYPLMNPERMADYFESKGNVDHFTAHPMPWAAWGESGGFDRLDRHYFAFGKYDFSYPSTDLPGSRLVHVAYKLCALFLPKKRRLPQDIKFYGGSNWWNLTRDSAQAILTFLDLNPEFSRMFRFTRCSDEIFFQTLLLNARPECQFINNDLRCVFWDGRRNGMPATVQEEDFEEIAASGMLFTRKVHPQSSGSLLDGIDRELLR